MNTTQQQAKTLKEPFFSLARAMDACCCYFLSAGLLYGIFKTLESGPLYPGAYLYYPALFVLLFFILSRRLALIALPCAAIFLAFSYYRELAWLDSVLEFAYWWAAGFTPFNEVFYNYFYIAIRMIMAGSIAMGIWLLIRKRRLFWLLFIGCPAAIAALAYFGLRDFSISIYLLAAGLIPLAAARTVSRDPRSRGLAAAFALPLRVAGRHACFGLI